MRKKIAAIIPLITIVVIAFSTSCGSAPTEQP
jgi:hypothetical protein